MKKSLVSIIMGAYNCEKTIRNCIESVLNQSYLDWELIICDDASTDNTYAILAEYANMDNRIRILKNNENMRLAASLNRCLKEARGKYVARVDADDEYTYDKLEKQVLFMEKNSDIDVSGTGRILFDENGEYATVYEKDIPSKTDLLFDAPFAHPTIMMKKEVYEALNGYNVSKDTMRCEDLDLWFRFFEQGYRGANIHEPLYRYHLSRNDYKKRSLTAAIGTTKIFIRGYKKIGIPFYYYVFAFKPIIAAIIPNKLMYKIHRNRFVKESGANIV